MNTKTVCRELNISQKALRIYEEYSIVVPKRSENNYRDYSGDDLLKLRQVMLLKELGFSLKDIKVLLNKNNFEDNKFIRSLYLQLNAVENKISELEQINVTLKQSINDVLSKETEENYMANLNEINDSLNENKERRKCWIDKWGFDSWAKNYDNCVKENYNDELNLFEKYDEILEIVRQKVLENNSKKVLDIGCGTGNLLGNLSDNIDITGVDQSIEMLLIAKSKYPKLNLRLGNFLDEPFVQNEFDAVVSTYAFHHLNSSEKEFAINLMLKYLKSNGRIIIADLMFLNENERKKYKDCLIKNERKDLWDIIEDEYYTDIESIKKYVEFLGCTIKYNHIANFTWIIEIKKTI